MTQDFDLAAFGDVGGAYLVAAQSRTVQILKERAQSTAPSQSPRIPHSNRYSFTFSMLSWREPMRQPGPWSFSSPFVFGQRTLRVDIGEWPLLT